MSEVGAVLTNIQGLAGDVFIATLGSWFVEYLLAPGGLIALWPDTMSRVMAEGALSVGGYLLLTGGGGGWLTWLLHMGVGGVLGYYVLDFLKGGVQ